MRYGDRPGRKTKTVIYLEPEQHERLKKISRETNVSFAEYVRLGVDLFFKHYEKDLGVK